MSIPASRETAILCGLFLSKYDKKALEFLGFNSFAEAYNVLGHTIGTKPASIKNYRDELDPYFPNPRQGWHKRELRPHCSQILSKYKALGFIELTGLISKFFNTPTDERISEDSCHSHTFAQRLITGKAAEQYFVNNFSQEKEFFTKKLIDVTHTGCGYDFRLEESGSDNFFAVEVKGLRSERGNIMLTQKEHRIAGKLKENYFLYLVKNFDEKPQSILWNNPLQANIQFKKREQQITQISWNAQI